MEPILDAWKAGAMPVLEYPAGSDGPSEAQEMLAARPRLVAWPLGVAGVLAGGLGLLSAALRGSSEEDAAQDAPPR